MFFLFGHVRTLGSIRKGVDVHGEGRKAGKPNTGNKVCYSDSFAICYIPVHRKVATNINFISTV